MSLFQCLGRTKGSVQVRGSCLCFVSMPVFTVRSCQRLAQPPSWKTTPCRLSATAYSIYSQLPSILEAVPPSETPRRAMPWWQVPTYYGRQAFVWHVSYLEWFETRRCFVGIVSQTLLLEYGIRRVKVNEDVLKLNGTHQLLVYADDVNILGGSVHIIKKNTEALI